MQKLLDSDFSKNLGEMSINFFYLKYVLTSFQFAVTSSCLPPMENSSDYFEASHSKPLQLPSTYTNTGTVLIW